MKATPQNTIKKGERHVWGIYRYKKTNLDGSLSKIQYNSGNTIIIDIRMAYITECKNPSTAWICSVF